MIHMIHTHKIVGHMFGTNVEKHTEVGHIFGTNSCDVGMYVYMCVCMYVCIYVCMYVCMCVYIFGTSLDTYDTPATYTRKSWSHFWDKFG